MLVQLLLYVANISTALSTIMENLCNDMNNQYMRLAVKTSRKTLRTINRLKINK